MGMQSVCRHLVHLRFLFWNLNLKNGVLKRRPLFTHQRPFSTFFVLFLRTQPNICFPWLHKKLAISGTDLAQIKSSSINWNAAISQIYPPDSPSHPGGIGRAVGVLWDWHKLCEHSCRAILVCLLAQWLHACLFGSLFASDGKHRKDEESRVQASWSRGLIFSLLGLQVPWSVVG